MDSNILRIKCRDEKGLIYKITKVIFENDLNIVSNNEFVEKESQMFFMRSGILGSCNKTYIVNELLNVLPTEAEVNFVEDKNKRIVIFATKEYHCLADILLRVEQADLSANILAVISNYDSLEALVRKFNIPFIFISHEGKSREEHEDLIHEELGNLDPDFLVLAKYMRVLSSSFVDRYEHRIINIHHSFLPAFAGGNPYRQAFQSGVKIIGATAHFVTEVLDEGPIIAQSVIPVAHSHSLQEMINAGRDIEKLVLSKSLKLVLEEKIFISGRKTIILD
ncbi:MAG TPA: formyltetrahydrofolate deformylase [Cytophagaceae bacterium]|jgi:formyltetrahydrofolate deformylase